MNIKGIIIFIIASLALVMCACSSAGSSSDNQESWNLDQSQLDSLMQQVAKYSYPEKEYEQYMPEEAFAEAHLFGIERDGNDGTAYAMLASGLYVILHGSAYMYSGAVGEVIIQFTYSDNDPKVYGVVWSDDGELHEKWIKNHFPKSSLRAWKRFDDNDYSTLLERLNDKVVKSMGVPVETEYTLSINDEDGTYEIFEAIEGGEGDTYSFDTKTIYSGKLSDLAKDKN